MISNPRLPDAQVRNAVLGPALLVALHTVFVDNLGNV